MAMYYKIGAMLVLLFLYSSQSISATANNVKCNGCVGSKDLKNNAVTGSKIKKNAVTGSKIKAGAVTGDKIKDGSVSVEDLSLELQGEISAAVTGDKIEAGAVTRDKLGADVDAILNNVGDNFSLINDNDQRITNLESANTGGVVEVGSSSGASYPDPLTAMADLATWCGTPSAANPCLMKILPGVYALGDQHLVMQPFVNIEGSGEQVTRLTGTLAGFGDGIVLPANNTELRSLTVEHLAPGAGTAIFVKNVDETTLLTEVTAISTGTTGANYGIVGSNAMFRLDRVSAKTTGATSQNSSIYLIGSSSAQITRSHASASGASKNIAVLASSSVILTISHSMLNATSALYLTSSSNTTVHFSTLNGNLVALDAPTVKVTHSHIDGTVSATGTWNCVFVSDGSFSELNGNCQ